MNERTRTNLLPAEDGRAVTVRSPRPGLPAVALCCHAPGDDRALLFESAPTLAAVAQAQGWTLVLSCEPLGDRTAQDASHALVGELLDEFDFVLAVGPDVVVVDPLRDPVAAAADDADLWLAPGALLARSCDSARRLLADRAPTGERVGDLAALWNQPTPGFEQVADGLPATRATALGVRRDAIMAEFPASFQRLRSPASAGVDLGPRRQAAEVTRSLDDLSADELRAIVRELGESDEAHRTRLRELLDQVETAVFEQVRVERRTGELVEQVQRLEAELEAMRSSKLFRAVAPLRRLYAKARGWRRG